MNPLFNIHPDIEAKSAIVMDKIRPAFTAIDGITEYNQQKVLAAFIKNRISESHFNPSTGYGYGDRGREVLDQLFADAVGAQDALVRHSFMSGTHTLSVALFGVLRPGDILLSVTGTPYDTIHSVIGLRGESQGSLKDFGITYRQVDLKQDGTPDIPAITAAVRDQDHIRMAYIQRSRGYSLRPTLSVESIGEIALAVRTASPDTIVFVDNCYGEFVQKKEPTEAGADLMAGSLIKNPGGGIAPTGGYIAGRRDLVEQCAFRHSTPGTGREIGATLGHSRDLYLGLFSAPHVTGEALKTAVFAAGLLNEMGYDVSPAPLQTRYDIIQTLLLKKPEALIAFCRGIQSGAPVDSFVTPEPWAMPGYDCDVIMAAGAFTLGSSIELSCDAPLREPYAAWLQGGLNFHSGKTGVMTAASNLLTL